MVPQTATIEGPPSDALERDFDYDLLSPGSLLAKSVGEMVQLVRTDAKTGKLRETPAIIRSGANGTMPEVNGSRYRDNGISLCCLQSLWRLLANLAALPFSNPSGDPIPRWQRQFLAPSLSER